jgi:hypothetical protein
MVVFALGQAFFLQLAAAADPFDNENCERAMVNSNARSDPFSLGLTAEKLKREQNRFCFTDSESWPQFFIDTNIVYNWAYGYQRRPAIVWGGGNYLVVWAEYLSNYHLIIDYNVYCSRVSSNGGILDTIPVPISIAPGDQLFASVAYNDIDYFVVWSDGRSGNLDIYGTRVSQDGTVLDPEGILIWTTPNDEVRPRVAWDGANYLVVWHAIQPGIPTTSIYGARISPEGDLLDDYPIFVSNDTLMQNYHPAIAWDGTNYLVVWEDSGGCYDSISIRGVRISPQGSVLDPDPIVITRLARFTSYPSVAWSGTNYLVVWKYFLETYYPNDIYGTRVAPDGQVLDSSGIPIGSVEGAAEEFPSVDWDGTNFFVTWRRTPNTSTLGARVTPQGEVLDPDGIDLGGGGGYNQKRPASASDGTTTLAVWEYQLDVDNWNICGIRVDSGGTILDSSFRVSIGSNSQTNGTVGWDGQNFLAVWQDLRVGQYSRERSVLNCPGMERAFW